MSFSFDTKKELCLLPLSDKSQIHSLCYGMLLFSKKFTYKEIVFTTENKFVGDKLEEILTLLYTPVLEKSAGLRVRNSQNRLITMRVLYESDSNRIFESFGYSKGDVSLRINRANITNEGQLSAFLRGVFLSCGSVTNPEKGYHIEFKVPYRNLANDLLTLLCEVENCSLRPKSVMRQGKFIVYIKDSEQIADFLTYIGAFTSSMSVMNTTVEKQVRNNTVRKINSELHNINKTAEASARQITAIKKLMKSKTYNSLSPELKEIAVLRLENPEMSLRDLGGLTKDNISRSGVNHRLKKLMSLIEDEVQ